MSIANITKQVFPPLMQLFQLESVDFKAEIIVSSWILILRWYKCLMQNCGLFNSNSIIFIAKVKIVASFILWNLLNLSSNKFIGHSISVSLSKLQVIRMCERMRTTSTCLKQTAAS